MISLSFYGFFENFLVIGEYNKKTLATNFSPIFLLHCHDHVAEIVTLIFRLFCSFQKCPLWTEELKLVVKIVELQ